LREGLAAIVAAVAGAVALPSPAKAANSPVVLNENNLASSATSITTTAASAFIGQSSTGYGIRGNSDSLEGVYGASLSGTGVHGYSERRAGYAAGVLGECLSTDGAGSLGANYATNGTAIGVQGQSDSPMGVATVGWARAGGLGLFGFSGPRLPAPAGKTGVYGRADQDTSSVGVRGASRRGRGGAFSGALAQLRLLPSASSSHPSSGATGDLFVDRTGRLWFCRGGTNWKQLA
jgi:hypothetical protein